MVKKAVSIIDGTGIDHFNGQLQIHRIKRAGEAQLVSHLQSVAAQGIGTQHAPIAVFDPGVVRTLDDLALQDELAEPRRIDRELSPARGGLVTEESAKISEGRHLPQARDFLDDCALARRQGLGQRDLVARDDAERSRLAFRRHGQLALQRQQRDQESATHGHTQDRQQRAPPIAQRVLENEPGNGDAGSPRRPLRRGSRTLGASRVHATNSPFSR